MKKNLLFVLAIFTGLISSASFAGECVLKINRTPCPGMEGSAFKPYKTPSNAEGNPTEEKKSAPDAAACEKQAEAAAKIVRKGALSAKKVEATFDGAAVKGASGASDCK